MRENAGGLFQVRDITCGCGRHLRVPVLGDVYSLVREGIEAEQREESELLLKFALDENDRLRADAARYAYLRDHMLHGVSHPHGSAIGMSEVLFGDDPDEAIDAAMKEQKEC